MCYVLERPAIVFLRFYKVSSRLLKHDARLSSAHKGKTMAMIAPGDNSSNAVWSG